MTSHSSSGPAWDSPLGDCPTERHDLSPLAWLLSRLCGLGLQLSFPYNQWGFLFGNAQASTADEILGGISWMYPLDYLNRLMGCPERCIWPGFEEMIAFRGPHVDDICLEFVVKLNLAVLLFSKDQNMLHN